MSVDHQIHALFIEKGWTLSLAESCTGGAISALLVQIPECSRYFLGSIVSYSNAAKAKLLGVTVEQTVRARKGITVPFRLRESSRGSVDRKGDSIGQYNPFAIDQTPGLWRSLNGTVIPLRALSELCAEQMAIGARKQFESTYALSVTGAAGPGGTKLGTVCFALASEKEVITTTSHFSGNRQEIIKQATDKTLYLLWDHVSINR